VFENDTTTVSEIAYKSGGIIMYSLSVSVLGEEVFIFEQVPNANTAQSLPVSGFQSSTFVT